MIHVLLTSELLSPLVASIMAKFEQILWERFGNILKQSFKVARYSFSRSIPPKFERKLRRHKQGFGKIDTTVVLDKEENWL